MTSTTRTGLAAALITTLFAGCLLGSMLLTAPTAGRRDPSPPPQQEREKDFDYVLRHPWWRQKPTAAQLEAAVQLVTDSKRGDVIWFDDACNTHRNSYATSGGVMQPELMLEVPAGWPVRHFHIYLTGDTRPSRDDVLRRLAHELDRKDFRDRR